jgi:hypothetical protein
MRAVVAFVYTPGWGALLTIGGVLLGALITAGITLVQRSDDRRARVEERRAAENVRREEREHADRLRIEEREHAEARLRDERDYAKRAEVYVDLLEGANRIRETMRRIRNAWAQDRQSEETFDEEGRLKLDAPGEGVREQRGRQDYA